MKSLFPTALVLLALLASSYPTLAQCPPQRLDPTDSGVRFGAAMTMNEDHLVIGDGHDTSQCTVRPDCSTGKVYAYQRDASGQWVFTQEVRPAALAPYFAFGGAVDLDGDRLIVGSSGPGAGDGLGAAYIFEYDGEEWVETAELRGETPYIGFGGVVAIGGNTAVVASDASTVFVYHQNGGQWEFVEMLQNPDSPDVRSDFGRAMDIDGQRVAIGAYLERVIASNGGAVYTYLRQPDGHLEFEQRLIAPDVLENPRFGNSVSLDGERLAVGAYQATRIASAQGVVYMHEFIDGRWELRQELVADDPVEIARFGSDVVLLGNRLAVGAATKQMPDRTGGAYLFERDTTGRWVQAASFSPKASQIDFGAEVGLGAGGLAVGAPRTQVAGVRHGSASVFDLSCSFCAPDLDADSTLTIFDFLTFFNLFEAGDAAADFDGDGELTIFDFLAYQTAFDVGCG